MIKAIQVKKIATLSGHKGSVYALFKTLVKGHFFSGGSDRIVVEWDVNNPAEGNLIAKSSDVIYSLHTDSKKHRLFIGQGNGGIHVINLENKTEERLLQFHTASVFAITESPRHNLFFSLSCDGEVGIFNADDLSLIKKLHLIEGKLRCAEINKNETLIAIGAIDGSIFIFSLPEMKPVKKWQAHKENFSVNALSFTADNKFLLSGSRDAHLNIYDVNNDYELIQSLPAHNFAIYAIAYSPDKKYLATASRDKTIKIWDAETFEVLVRIDHENYNGHVNSVNKIIWDQETGYLISASDDRNIMIWEIEGNTDKTDLNR